MPVMNRPDDDVKEDLVPSGRAADLVDVVRDAKYQDIARRVIQGQTPREIAVAHGMTVRAIHMLRNDPRFIELYKQVSGVIWGDADALLRDEKASITLRRAALQTRSVTLLADVLEAVQDHIDETEQRTGRKGNVKSTMLRAAVEAVREVTNINRTADQGSAGAGAAPTIGNFIVTPDAARLIRGAIDETGIDISDILDVEVISDTPSPAEGEGAGGE